MLKKEHAALEKGKGYVVIVMYTLVERIHSQIRDRGSAYNSKCCIYIVVVFYGTFLIYTHIEDVPRETSHKTCVHLFRCNDNIKTIILLY